MDKEAEIPKRPNMKGAWGEQDFRNLRAGWVPPGSSHWTKSSSFWRGSKSPAFFISAASQVSTGACSGGGGGGGPLKAAQCCSSAWASPTSPRSLPRPPPNPSISAPKRGCSFSVCTNRPEVFCPACLPGSPAVIWRLNSSLAQPSAFLGFS